jgi:aquaporin Z
LLGLFMISASLFTALLELPHSPFAEALPDPFLRRSLIGAAMGLTALLLILSPMGQRSGAHFNPAVTLAFWRLGKIAGWDAIFYIVAQFVGGVAGMAFAALFGWPALSDSSVSFVVTLPGPAGTAAAFLAETYISFMLMLTILNISNRPRLARYTPVVAATLVAVFIAFEAPLSGMSMNPARSFASAYVGEIWAAIWIYFTAPILGMLGAAAIFRRGGWVVHCAKLHHHNGARCIFRCAFHELAAQEVGAVAGSHDSYSSHSSYS